uniref:Phytocyanin domain-containing protein n=1 Tax=Opuntia streptacantha TaxID=393608 RepID=A0A7C9DGI0_OPUST
MILSGKRMSKKCCCIGLILLMICMGMGVPRSLGEVYRVGDSAGWALGVDYAVWSNSKTFLIGDTLVFEYGSGHRVDEVSERDYKTCRSRAENPINRDIKGSTTILLPTPGQRYFICGVIPHCGSGMKLAVNVLASGGPPTSAANYSTSSTTASPAATASGYDIFPTTATMIPDSASPSSSGSVSVLPAQRGLFVFCAALVMKLTVLL